MPSLAFSNLPWNPNLHNPTDTVEWMSGDKLAEVVSLVTEIVTAVQDKPLDWTRPAQDERTNCGCSREGGLSARAWRRQTIRDA